MKTTITIENGRITIEADDGTDMNNTKSELVTTPPIVDVAGEDMEATTLVKISDSGIITKANPIVVKPLSKEAVTQLADALTHTDDEHPPRAVETSSTGRGTDKDCADCGTTFHATGAGMHKRKYCDDCRAKRARDKVARKTSKQRDKNGPIVITKPPTTQQSDHLLQATKNVEPEFLPGYEKTPEEIEALRPIAPPEPAPKHNPDMFATPKGGFKNTWNCANCAMLGRLCHLHARMDMDGETPQKHWPAASF